MRFVVGCSQLCIKGRRKNGRVHWLSCTCWDCGELAEEKCCLHQWLFIYTFIYSYGDNNTITMCCAAKSCICFCATNNANQ